WEGVHLVWCTLYFCRPRVYADRVRLSDYAGCPDDRVRLPNYVGCPDDRVRITPSSVSYPISFSNSPFEWKGTDDYVSESACTIAETYDRTMADRYAEGTPQLDLDLEAWVDAAGGPRKGRVYDFGDSRDTNPMLSSYASSVAPPAYASSSATTPGSGGDDIRTLIRPEELSQQLPLHLGAMVEQLVAAIRGAGTSQQAPQVSITINFI
ncbi:hypothetical protein Taro_050782, partial [Colocasia esculenta]|nr:hypothetical protein [Colocasia esculenta]